MHWYSKPVFDVLFFSVEVCIDAFVPDLGRDVNFMPAMVGNVIQSIERCITGKESWV